MIPLSPQQKARCLDAMDQIQKYHISRMFSQPVDPIRDNCPTYFDVIAKPMDLETARKKLENDQYSTVEEWKSDIDLIWTNTVTFNGNKSLVTVLAKQLQAHFKEITSTLSSDPEADWNAKFEKLKAEINAVIKAAPKITTLVKYPPRKPVPTRSMSVQLQKYMEKEKKPTQSKPEVQEMTTDDVRRLGEDIYLIEEDDEVDEIIELIRKMEPEFPLNPIDEDGEIELEIGKLKRETLSELRMLVNALLGR